MWVKFNPAALATVAFRPMRKPMAENVFRALWAFIFTAIIVVVVSLVTKPRPVAELNGLVYGATAAQGRAGSVLQAGVVWAIAGVVIFAILNIIFW